MKALYCARFSFQYPFEEIKQQGICTITESLLYQAVSGSAAVFQHLCPHIRITDVGKPVSVNNPVGIHPKRADLQTF